MEKPLKRIVFEEIVDVDSSFNSSTFTARKAGYFLFHLSAGSHFNHDVNISVITEHGEVYFSLMANQSFYALPYSSNYITWVSSNQSVYVTSTTPLYSDRYGQLSFCGFQLDEDVMLPFITLQLIMHYLSENKLVISNISKTINWISKKGPYKFGVPVTGLYLASLSLQFTGWGRVVNKKISPFGYQEPVYETYASLQRSNDSHEVVLAYHHQDSSKIFATVATNSRLVSLRVEDEMVLDHVLPENTEVTIQFVLYSPIRRNKIAWSISEYTQEQTGKNSIICDVVKGVSWKGDFKVEIGREGIYYVSVSAVVIMESSSILMTAMLREEVVVGINLPVHLYSNVCNCGFTFHKATLAHLKEADVIDIKSSSTSGSGLERRHFSGFLLYPY